MTQKKLEIAFSAFAKPLSEQLEGFDFDQKTVEHFQKDLSAINRVRIRGLIPDSQADKSYKKLFKVIEKHISEHNKEIK